MRDELSIKARDSLSFFLAEHTWDCWFTATSAKRLYYPNQAIDMVTRCLPVSLRSFIGAERHYLGGWHAHGLVKFYEDEAYAFSPRFGEKIPPESVFEGSLGRRGYCRVEACNSTAAVAAYVAKYITKDLDSEWQILGRSW
jgi:hypothetical protein